MATATRDAPPNPAASGDVGGGSRVETVAVCGSNAVESAARALGMRPREVTSGDAFTRVLESAGVWSLHSSFLPKTRVRSAEGTYGPLVSVSAGAPGASESKLSR